MTTLPEIKSALEQPFPVEAVQFLLKDVRQKEGKWSCLALPYCNKRVYEDRLNQLAYGEWQTHPIAPSLQGNKLIIPASVTLCGVTHVDYGEAFLAIPTKNGAAREDENSATEAYSQAFRRVCSKFGLGRYLYDLGRLRLPYHPEQKHLAITRAEQMARVEQLYRDAGLLPPALPLTAYPDDAFLDWAAQQVERDAIRIQGICAFYQVPCLSDLSQQQRENLTLRLKRQHEKASVPVAP